MTVSANTAHPSTDAGLTSGCEPSCQLIPASEFTVEELTESYNQSRVDYIVPMPMNVARLQSYIDDYELDLGRSVVAQDGAGDTLGLAMLGVRPGHTWITRLGVLPGRRRTGAGEAMMRYLVDQSRSLGADHIILEVIKNNVPAHRLFRKLGFVETRELLILRRPPGPPNEEVTAYSATHGDQDRALSLLQQRRSVPSWLDEYPSLRNSGNLSSIEVICEDGARGWLVYQSSIFQLGRLVPQTEAGDPVRVARVLVHALHTRHAVEDTKTENIPAADPHLPGLLSMHYIESFRRIEMRLNLA